ncbi:MAG: formylglycine-generating enzyme family protein, partial [Planctomycetaceae bacterium]
DWNAEIPRVQQKRPTDWGLYDLHGLVWEWCHDEYSPTAYAERAMLTVEPGAAARDDYRKRGTDLARRVLRGGSSDSSAAWSRSAFRYGDWANVSYGSVGFRVALVPVPARAQVSADQAQGGAGSAAGPPTSGP